MTLLPHRVSKKLHDFPRTPSPRRARMFAAERGIALETVQVGLMVRGQPERAF